MHKKSYPQAPDRHPNRDFFVCDIFDGVPFFKDDMASMEHPIFSLSTKPDMRHLKYEHGKHSLEITPSGLGLPTIHDKDILIFIASKLRAAVLDGKEPNIRVQFTGYEFFVSTNRDTSGRAYLRFTEALNRLRGTTLKTNIETGGYWIEEGFGFIDGWKAVKEDQNGRPLAVEVRLSDWTYNAILGNELLTINRDYFRLRKPLERRVYELARKHCGDQKSFKISLAKLQKKVGSTAARRNFRLQVTRLSETDHLPDYSVSIVDDMITFKNRNQKTTKPQSLTKEIPPPHPQVIEQMKEVAPGWDVYHLWELFKQKVLREGMPKNPARAAVGYAKKVGEQDPKR